jgi:endonuclease YncB( thermonuclease family)
MNYKTLISKLKSQLDSLEYYNQDDSARIKTMDTAWTIGQEVYQSTQETGQSIKKFADDTDAEPAQLQKMVRFYRLFPKGYKDTAPLGLSHYAEVLSVRSHEGRQFYIDQAIKENWSSRRLRASIQNNYFETHQISAGKKTGTTLKPGQRYLYIYMADVLEVIDGDTLHLDIDVGFHLKKFDDRVRLAGINCPEVGTKLGDKAKNFVENEMAKCVPNVIVSNRAHAHTAESPTTQTIYCPKCGHPIKQAQSNRPLIAIRTHKASEKFGRYLVDVYYLPGETNRETIVRNGIWLNKLLVDKGLAVVV